MSAVPTTTTTDPTKSSNEAKLRFDSTAEAVWASIASFDPSGVSVEVDDAGVGVAAGDGLGLAA
jgi:hypothetical protein